jgi:DNA-binding NarL/FixJ family response regulator
MRKHTTPKAIKIVVATGDPNLQSELKEKLETDPFLQVVGKASTGIEALIRCGELTPVLVLMDLQMPEADGITGTQMVKTGFPEIKVLIIGVKSEEELKSALKSDADGYLRRTVETKELIDAVRNVILGISVNNDYLYIP